MTQLFTPEDLIQYLYKETTPAQSLAIEQAMEADWTLREKFEVIKKAHARLEKFKISPRVETILDVLRYANKETIKL